MPSVTLHVVEFAFSGGFESLPLRQIFNDLHYAQITGGWPTFAIGTTEAAPRFAVFEAWAPRTSTRCSLVTSCGLSSMLKYFACRLDPSY